jgi:hypothetical protein
MSTIKDSPPLQKVEQRVEFERKADLEMIRQQEKERSNYDRMVGVFGINDPNKGTKEKK